MKKNDREIGIETLTFYKAVVQNQETCLCIFTALFVKYSDWLREIRKCTRITKITSIRDFFFSLHCFGNDKNTDLVKFRDECKWKEKRGRNKVTNHRIVCKTNKLQLMSFLQKKVLCEFRLWIGDQFSISLCFEVWRARRSQRVGCWNR